MRWIRIYAFLYVLLLLLLGTLGAPVVFPGMRYTLTTDERDYLESRGTLLALGDDNFPPFSYVREGRATGFERDLVFELARVLGINIIHKQGRGQRCALN